MTAIQGVTWGRERGGQAKKPDVKALTNEIWIFGGSGQEGHGTDESGQAGAAEEVIVLLSSECALGIVEQSTSTTELLVGLGPEVSSRVTQSIK